MSAVTILGDLDANHAWNGSRLHEDRDFTPGEPVPDVMRGAGAYVKGEGDRWRLARDGLGLNKLFWAPEAAGGIAVAARPWRLVAAGHPLGDVCAIPRGCVADLSPEPSECAAYQLPVTDWRPRNGEPALDLAALAEDLRRRIDAYLAALARAQPDARAFVCLSGGLDSSGIAALVRRHFDRVTAVSFDLAAAGEPPSEDRLAAQRVAADLGVPLLEATVDEVDLLANLDVVLRDGIDWRDFNVHAGLVNATLAEAVSAAQQGRPDAGRALVFTGDLANEFLADYTPERYRGRTYYRLPRLRPAALRATLVQGLDSCHREIGVFAAWGLPVVQPYAVVEDAYAQLPDTFLAADDAKQRFCRAAFGDLLPPYVYARKKVRAQSGSLALGKSVLAACVDRGIDGRWLRRRFAELHGMADPADLDRFVRAGRYRALIPPVPARKASYERL